MVFLRDDRLFVLTKGAQSLPGKVVLTFRLDRHVSSSSPPAQSSLPSQACSSGMNRTERLQKKYLLSISCLTAVGKEGEGGQTGCPPTLPGSRSSRRRRRNGDSLKKAAMARMARTTTTAKTVITTRFLLDDLSFSVRGALIGLLWRPGRGTTGVGGRQQHET